MKNYNNTIQSKIYDSKNNKYLELVQNWKNNNEKIVFTNGCFDILHYGHIDYLSKAASFGNKMIIGLNSDQSVKILKGESRPINDIKTRASILSSLFFVDAVIIFEEETPYNLIKSIIPDVLIKGADYNISDIVGYDIIKTNGGEINTLDFIEGYSSSKIIEKIKII